jgi:hypothetical protein
MTTMLRAFCIRPFALAVSDTLASMAAFTTRGPLMAGLRPLGEALMSSRRAMPDTSRERCSHCNSLAGNGNNLLRFH